MAQGQQPIIPLIPHPIIQVILSLLMHQAVKKAQYIALTGNRTLVPNSEATLEVAIRIHSQNTIP